MIRTGIFGGSFNPIHNGHINLAHYLLQEEKVEEIWLMVSPHNPLKDSNNLLMSICGWRWPLKLLENTKK